MLLPDIRRVSSLRTKILDFGIAKLTLALGGGKTVADFLGTPKYASPEQIQSPASVDEKADVYSLGCILYECASGAPPFDAETPFELMWKQLHQTPARLNTMAAHIGVELADLIEAMLHKDRTARPNMDQVLAVLSEVRERCSFQTVVRLDPQSAEMTVASQQSRVAALPPVLPLPSSQEPILGTAPLLGFARPPSTSLMQMIRRRWRFVALGGAGMALLMLGSAGLGTRLSSSPVASRQMAEQVNPARTDGPAMVQSEAPSSEPDATKKDAASSLASSSLRERASAKKSRRAGLGDSVSAPARKPKHATVF